LQVAAAAVFNPQRGRPFLTLFRHAGGGFRDHKPKLLVLDALDGLPEGLVVKESQRSEVNHNWFALPTAKCAFLLLFSVALSHHSERSVVLLPHRGLRVSLSCRI
jgi:hypothetical protein